MGTVGANQPRPPVDLIRRFLQARQFLWGSAADVLNFDKITEEPWPTGAHTDTNWRRVPIQGREA
eukprot:1440322-Prorocentrum_lima.AAC.1